MLPRDPRRQNNGRGGSKVDRVPGRQNVSATRSGGNAPVMGTVIGFSPAATTSATNERLLFTFQVLIGYTVEVQVRTLVLPAFVLVTPAIQVQVELSVTVL